MPILLKLKIIKNNLANEESELKQEILSKFNHESTANNQVIKYNATSYLYRLYDILIFDLMVFNSIFSLSLES